MPRTIFDEEIDAIANRVLNKLGLHLTTPSPPAPSSPQLPPPPSLAPILAYGHQ